MPRTLKIVYYVAPDKAALAERAAEYIAVKAEQAVAARGRARIAISGGSTPKTTFEVLAEGAGPWHKRMPWDKLDLFWVDERSVPPDDAESNYLMTRKAMLDYVPLKPEQIHRIEGEREPDDAAARYEAELRQCFKLGKTDAPQFDVVQLGMGPDGHTGSLFPYTDALRETTKLVTANYVEEKDAWRVTLTWPVINQARDVFFLVAGAEKALILNQVFEGPHIPDRMPSQLIVPSGDILTLLLDKAAAALLPETDAQGCGELERIV